MAFLGGERSPGSSEHPDTMGARPHPISSWEAARKKEGHNIPKGWECFSYLGETTIFL